MDVNWNDCVNWVKVEEGQKKYNNIMNLYNTITPEVSWNDLKYKKWRTNFNGFYRVRRDETFQQEYYKYLLDKRGLDLSFEEVLHTLKSKTNRVEASFSSKLLATINPHKPVWDTEILKKLGFKAPYSADRNRVSKIINCYHKIEDWYEEELRLPKGKEMIRIFDKKMGQQNLTSVKKIDLMLWQKDR